MYAFLQKGDNRTLANIIAEVLFLIQKNIYVRGERYE